MSFIKCLSEGACTGLNLIGYQLSLGQILVSITIYFLLM